MVSLLFTRANLVSYFLIYTYIALVFVFSSVAWMSFDMCSRLTVKVALRQALGGRGECLAFRCVS